MTVRHVDVKRISAHMRHVRHANGFNGIFVGDSVKLNYGSLGAIFGAYELLAKALKLDKWSNTASTVDHKQDKKLPCLDHTYKVLAHVFRYDNRDDESIVAVEDMINGRQYLIDSSKVVKNDDFIRIDEFSI